MGDYKTSKIDEKIKGLCDFINSLKDTRTIGSCQGHDDNDNFDHPYIKFACINNRVLGFLAGMMDSAYSDPEYMNEWGLWLRPKLEGYWEITVDAGEGADFSPEELGSEGRRTDEYAVFVLSAERGSYDKPSELYGDIEEIEKYYKKRIKGIPELLRVEEA